MILTEIFIVFASIGIGTYDVVTFARQVSKL